MLILLLENRVEFLKNKYIPMLVAGLTPDDPNNPPKRPRKRPYVGNMAPNAVLWPNGVGMMGDGHINPPDAANRIFELVEANDPSPNKVYMEWMLQRFLMGDYPLEDVERLKDACDLHMRMKLHRLLPTEEADILKFPTVRAFLDNMLSKYKEDEHGIVSDPAYEKEMEQQSIVLMNDTDFSVVMPKTKEAACWFGRATGWCTVWGTKFAREVDKEKTNRYNLYAKDGPLYIIYDKKANTRYQFSFDSKPSQFMNVNDQPIGMDRFWAENPKLFYNFLIWRGLAGGVEWKELARLPLNKLVIGQMPEDVWIYRIWRDGTQPPHITSSTNAMEAAMRIPIKHSAFSTNHTDGTGTIYAPDRVVKSLDVERVFVEHFPTRWNLHRQEGADSHRIEFINWMNSEGLRGDTETESGINSLTKMGIYFNGDTFGTYDQLRSEVVRGDDLVWTTIEGRIPETYFCEAPDGTIESHIRKTAGNTGASSLSWLNSSPESVMNTHRITDLIGNEDDLKKTLPTILERYNSREPLTPEFLGETIGDVLYHFFKPSGTAELFNTLGLNTSNPTSLYNRYDVILSNGKYMSFEQAAKILMKVGDVTVYRAIDSHDTPIHRLYENGKRLVTELEIFGSRSRGSIEVGLRQSARLSWKKNDPNIQSKCDAYGPVLWPILEPLLADDIPVTIDNEVMALCHFMPKKDFVALRAALESGRGHTGQPSTLPNLVKHGFVKEARAMVEEHTNMTWNGSYLIIKKFEDFSDFIESHGDDEAKQHLSDLEEFDDNYIQVHDSDYGYIMSNLIGYMKPKDRESLVRYIAKNVDTDEVDMEEIDLTDPDDIVKAGRSIHEIDSGFVSAMADVQRLAMENDIFKHYKSALEKAQACYMENGEIKFGLRYDTPYYAVLDQKEVFAALGDNHWDDYDWDDLLNEDYDSDKRVKLSYPYNGWDNSLDTEQEKDYAQNELMDRFYDVDFE